MRQFQIARRNRHQIVNMQRNLSIGDRGYKWMDTLWSHQLNHDFVCTWWKLIRLYMNSEWCQVFMWLLHRVQYLIVGGVSCVGCYEHFLFAELHMRHEIFDRDCRLVHVSYALEAPLCIEKSPTRILGFLRCIIDLVSVVHAVSRHCASHKKRCLFWASRAFCRDLPAC